MCTRSYSVIQGSTQYFQQRCCRRACAGTWRAKTATLRREPNQQQRVRLDCRSTPHEAAPFGQRNDVETCSNHMRWRKADLQVQARAIGWREEKHTPAHHNMAVHASYTCNGWSQYSACEGAGINRCYIKLHILDCFMKTMFVS